MKPKVLFVQCFVTNRETAPREQAFARVLRDLGYPLSMFTMTRGKPDTRTVDDILMQTFRVDDRTAPKHMQFSSDLVEAAREYAPDVVVFKNIGFAIIDQLAAVLPPTVVYGTILGGGLKSKQINLMDMFFVEYKAQIGLLEDRPKLKEPLLQLMPKLVFWSLIEKVGRPERIYDVCVVGSFNPRKNQKALIPLFDDVSIAFAGNGSTLEEIQAAAAGRPNVHFLGRVAHEDVFPVMCQSKLLVHPSFWEGVPRVSAEAFACGTPMVALRSTLGKAYANESFVQLVDDDSEIRDAVLAILNDPARLAEMSRAAREYAETVHGPNRIQEMGTLFDEFVAKRIPWKQRVVARRERKKALSQQAALVHE
ncbi:glycosyltransferase family 4 protein [Roseomonas sp. WA12]